ncbi:MAG TPA: glycine betaine ABC transporter substrate-binding protein [Bryobacteraceae bacterium]|nr:glycine betaine ABC transporter substrate-binding protein [Bryobacteraceae bacterium]
MDRKTFIAGLSLMLASCGSRKNLVVGSKNFTEQVLLGEILARQIERRLGVSVDRKLNLGGTMLAHEALLHGSLDLYPEYTGTALAEVLKRPALPDAKMRDAQAVFDTVRREYRRRWQLEWLSPLGFNNTFAMVVRRDAGVATLTAAAKAHPWRLGMGYEFAQRPDGLDGLLKTYGLRLAGQPATMDLGLLYSALENRQVDLIAANSTDGLISALPVLALEDDRHYFPPYQCAVVVRQSALARYPPLRAALEQLSGKLPDEAMRRLNFEVDGKHRPAGQAAEEFLRGV